jgi:hypothetical protein
MTTYVSTPIANPNVADRADQSFWVAPIGLPVIEAAPVYVSSLPTSDPLVIGQLWSNSGVVTASGGP